MALVTVGILDKSTPYSFFVEDCCGGLTPNFLARRLISPCFGRDDATGMFDFLHMVSNCGLVSVGMIKCETSIYFFSFRH